MRSILLCLHGWGGSKESFTELRAALNGTDLDILTPDLPGFGSEPDPPRPWTTDDYADWVVRWFHQRMENGPAFAEASVGKKWKMDEPILLLGHSHGGRIAVKLAARMGTDSPTFSIRHLYLCAPAGIRHPRHFKRIIGLTLAKTGKFFLSIPGLKLLQPLGKKFLYRLVRVHDYEKASPVMRETLQKVSAEDLRRFLPMIHVPTDIFWGAQDGMTPVSDAKVFEKGIQGSSLHIFHGVRHAVHRDAKSVEAIASSILSELI